MNLSSVQMAQNQPNHRLAHVSRDEERARPPEIRGPPRQSPTRHRPPHRNDIQEQQVTYEQFFHRDTPFDWDTVQGFADMEANWPIPWLPQSPFDGASLRLYVWRGSRPTPADHWEQTVARMPFLAEQEEIKNFALKFARATYECTRGGKSRRCPYCGSQLLGEPLYDHGIFECPFGKLPEPDRFRFLAINLVSYCQQCNSRSATHTGCRPVNCLVCRSPDHSLASGICLDPELRELTADQLRDRANHHRRDYLRHIRGLLASPNNPLQYRLPSDSPYISLYRREVPAGEERRGLQILRVENNEFPGTRLAEYRGAPGSLIREFITLRPPEFDNWNQLMIPIFDEDSARYLEEIARVVTRIREDPNSARTFELPAAPHANQNGVRQQRQNPVLPAEPRARPVNNRPVDVPNANQAIRREQPLVETPILRADPPGLRAPPTVPPYVPAGTTNQAKASAAKNRAPTNYMRRPPPRPLTEDPGSQPCSSSQIAPATAESASSSAQAASSSTINIDNMFNPETYASMGPWSNEMERRSTVPQRTNFASVPAGIESQEAHSQDNTLIEASQIQPANNMQMIQPMSHHSSNSAHNEGTESQSRGNSRESAVGRPSSQNSWRTASPQDQLEANLEREIQANAIFHCHEHLRVDGTPMRPAFQHRAFKTILDLAPVERTAAQIIRIQTLQFIITAQKDERMEVYHYQNPRLIKDYLDMLIRLGEALSTTDIMVVKLEKRHKTNIIQKRRAGTDIFPVPSFDLWTHTHVANAMEFILGTGEVGVVERIYNFNAREPRLWFELDHPIDIDLPAELQRAREQQILQTVRPTERYHPRTLAQLEATSRLPIPLDISAIHIQIEWMTLYLSGTSLVDQNHVPEYKIMACAEMLRAILELLIYLRQEFHFDPAVRFIDCGEELGVMAARGHNIVAPTLRLFAYRDVVQVKAYLQIVWSSLIEAHQDKPE
ncbi:hypothetical protein CRE_13316 [Caenorhabditis remanei]|uniref:Uncharacterized protein n=1 Tax=Caenorhabditis remanei TaxID=31234 RepID=E3M862_CAERE|nr:hypothetical protein CRE_13316 [Caenorhabditis remanei]